MQKDRQYAGVRASDRKAERRSRLIQAAIEVYARRGYHAATVREICAEADLTSRYFYESFEGREQLFEVAYDRVVDHLIRILAAVGAEHRHEGRKAVAAVQRAYFEELKANPQLARVFLMDLSNISPALDGRFEEVTEKIALFFADAVPVRDGDASVQLLTRSALVAGIVHIARIWVRDEYRMPIETVLSAALELYDREGLI